MHKVNSLVLASLLLAVLIVFERFISLQTPILRLSFSYIPCALAGWLLGPVWAALIGALGDILGMLIMPKGGAYFPGFTLSAALTCWFYGMFLHYKAPRNKLFIVRLVLALLTIHVFVRIGLTTLWLSIITKRAFIALIAGRIAANIITFPIEVFSIYFIARFLEPYAALYLKPFDTKKENDAFLLSGAGDI